MGFKTDTVDSNITYSYSFPFTEIICIKYLQVNVYKIFQNLFSLCYKIFLLNHMHIYFMLFCKMQICNAIVKTLFSFTARLSSAPIELFDTIKYKATL